MKQFILPAATLALTACAGTANDFYRPADSPGEFGYSEVQLDDDRYRVSFTGNGTVDEAAVKELALMRAAELTQQEDYDWFRIVTVETEETTRTVSSPDETTIISTDDSTTIVQGDEDDSAIVLQEDSDNTEITRECGPLGCTTTVTPDYTGPEVITTREADTVATTIEIEMGEGEVVNPTSVYNADSLYEYLEERYT